MTKPAYSYDELDEIFRGKGDNDIVGMSLIDGLDLHIAYERDMPIDRGNLVQQLLLIHLSWDFSLVGAEESPTAQLRRHARF